MSNNKVIQKSHQIPKTTKPLEHKVLSNCVESLGMGKIQQHTFIRAEQPHPNYCSKPASLESWEYLKSDLKSKNFKSRKQVIPFVSLELDPIACRFLVLDS